MGIEYQRFDGKEYVSLKRYNNLLCKCKALEQENKKLKMYDKEKMLAIQILLISVRGSFGCDERVFKARELCKQLKENGWEYADIFINSINYFISNEAEIGFDGRFFRTNYKYGGYENMEELHGLDNTIKGRSLEFLTEILPLLPYPTYQFKDWIVK